eukprot:620403_1
MGFATNKKLFTNPTTFMILLLLLTVSSLLWVYGTTTQLISNPLEQMSVNTTSQIPNIKAMDKKDGIDRSKWHNCFISDTAQSSIGLKYEYALHGELLNTLIQSYIASNRLKIFTLHFMRYANIYGFKCGIPMQSFHVGKEYYYTNNQFYHREHNRDNAHVDLCVFYDFYALYKYIYDTYNEDTTTEWAIILEDDVSLCPLWINATLNVLDQETIDFVYYGYGATGTLLRISFIPFLFTIMDRFVASQSRKMARNRHNTIDHWLPIQCVKRGKGDHCVSSAHSVLFHPAWKRTKSTFNHKYNVDYKCDESIQHHWGGYPKSLNLSGYI